MLPENILVVEDELIVKLNLEDILSDLGIDSSDFVESADKALFMLENNVYDIIIMDINIKGSMDGIVLSEKIVQMYDVPIVYMTSYYDQDTIDQAVEISPYGYITKPFTPVDIKLALTVAHRLFTKERKKLPEETNSQMVCINESYEYSKEEEVLYFKNQPLKLSKHQTKLLKLFIKNMNHSVSAETITQEIWGDDCKADSSLRTLIYSFRKKCPDIPLRNNGWRGYCLEKSVET